jgi:hypothetical protein
MRLRGFQFHRTQKFLGAIAKFWKATVSFVTLLRPSTWNNSGCLWNYIMKSDIWGIFENLSRMFTFNYNLTIVKGALHEYSCTFMKISCRILLRMRNVSGKKCCRENQYMHFMFNNILYSDTNPKLNLISFKGNQSPWKLKYSCME